MNSLSKPEINQILVSARSHYESNSLQQAAQLYSKIYTLDPSHFESGERLGVIMAKTNNNQTAKKIFEKLLEFYPNDANTHNNLSNVLNSLNENQSAIKHSEIAVKIDPRNPAFYLNLARLYVITSEFEKAYIAYSRVVELDPKNVRAARSVTDLAIVLHPEESYKHLKHLYSLAPTFNYKISLETFVPNYFNSQQEIDDFRSNLLDRLKKLISEEDIRVSSVEEKIYHTFFYLAYHNRNNKELKVKLAQLHKKAIPVINYVNPYCIGYKYEKSKKIKVGFLSGFFHKHPVSQCFNGIVTLLAEDDRFEVYAIYVGIYINVNNNLESEELKKIKSSKAKLVAIKEDIDVIRSTVSEMKLDALLYLDIGMYWLSYYLAFSRLAPVQCVMLGHPDTTGIETIDYYLSCNDLEGEGAEEYYSEELVRLKHIPSYITKPQLPERFKTRLELNLPVDKNIYYCPMKNQKIHPDFDSAIKSILEKDENSIIMFPTDQGTTSEVTKKRMKKNLGNKLFQRIVYHPWATNTEFLSYLNEADVVLDTFYFGAGTTLYFAFAVGAPVITLPGMTSGGRVTNAVYRKIGITELIAKDKNQYVELAVNYATNKDLKNAMKERIKGCNNQIYNDESAISEIQTFLEQSLKRFS